MKNQTSANLYEMSRKMNDKDIKTVFVLILISLLIINVIDEKRKL